MSKNNYWVSPSKEGWKAKREGAGRAAGIFDTQRDAENFAHNILQESKGGELITQNRQGEIRSKDTINSFDPYPPKDKEN